MAQPVAQLPAPCPASWTGMTPTTTGRYCAACRTEVIDFTRMSSVEILAYWQQQQGKTVCGRLRSTQILPTTAAKGLRNYWRGWLGTLLTTGSLGTILLSKALAWVPANAERNSGLANQRSTASETLARESLSTTHQANGLTADSSLIKGVVRDARTKEPLPGIAVLVQGTHKITYTNADGKFMLKVASTNRRVKLLAAFPGYKKQQQNIPAKAKGKTVLIELEEDTIMLGKITIPSISSGS